MQMNIFIPRTSYPYEHISNVSCVLLLLRYTTKYEYVWCGVNIETVEYTRYN